MILNMTFGCFTLFWCRSSGPCWYWHLPPTFFFRSSWKGVGSSTNRWSWHWRRRTSCCLNRCHGAGSPGPYLCSRTHCWPQGEAKGRHRARRSDHFADFLSQHLPFSELWRGFSHFDCRGREVSVSVRMPLGRAVFHKSAVYSLQGVSKYATGYQLTVERCCFTSTFRPLSKCNSREVPGV